MTDIISTIVIEFSPEVKQAFADLNQKLDALSEKLDATQQVKLCGRDLQGLNKALLTNACRDTRSV